MLSLDSRPMRTGGLAIVLATAALLVAGCSSNGSTAASTTAATTTGVTTGQAPTPIAPAVPPTTITAWAAARDTGPWSSSLSLQLPKEFGIPRSFYVCAVWKHAATAAPCKARVGSKLPVGTSLRLEQQPIGPAVTNPDTPGWGTVATSEEPGLSAVLSNFVTGNKPGTFTYRTTLRDRAGQVLARSNLVKVTWHK